MPIDDQGIRADIIISPESIFNRMIPARMYGQFLNRAGTLITDRVRKGVYGGTKSTVKTILEFLADVRPHYAKQVAESLKTSSDQERFLDAVEEDGLYYVIPPFCNSLSPARVLEIAKKWDIQESPVTYIQQNSDGSKQTIRTLDDVCIGGNYLYLLGKIPIRQMSAIQMGFVNQFGTPTKPTSKSTKAQSLFNRTPIRYGEDEVCIMSMSCGPETISRMMGMISGSPEATRELAKTLISHPTPSNIESIAMTDDEIIKSNAYINIFEHQMAAIGYDVEEGKNED